MNHALLLTVAMCACTPGTMSRGGVSDHLQSALYLEDVVEGVHHATVLLSNGRFTCELPSYDDPARSQQALQGVAAAACREGASHITISAWRANGSDWTGDYSATLSPGPTTISASQPKQFNATWYHVQEAYLVETQALDRAYAIESDELLTNLDRGALQLTSGTDQLDGVVYLDDPGVYAKFSATRCQPGDSLFSLLQVSPVTVCPR